MKIDLRRGDISAPKKPLGGMPPIMRRETTETKKPMSMAEETPVRLAPSIAPKIMDWIIIGAVYLLTFLIPLFFLPNVPSILELNKQLLLVVLGGIAFLAWIGKLAWEGRIRVKKNFLLVPVLLLLLILAAS